MRECPGASIFDPIAKSLHRPTWPIATGGATGRPVPVAGGRGHNPVLWGFRAMAYSTMPFGGQLSLDEDERPLRADVDFVGSDLILSTAAGLDRSLAGRLVPDPA